jgi:hypothetical protein
MYAEGLVDDDELMKDLEASRLLCTLLQVWSCSFIRAIASGCPVLCRWAG